MPEPYKYDLDTLGPVLDAAGITIASTMDVLYGARTLKRYAGPQLLLIVGRDRTGKWLAVSLLEGDNDEYEVTSARYLDPMEIATVSKIWEAQP